MIVSHKFGFIFIKTGKTAGTSIEVELNKILGPEDIATPIFPEVEGHTPKNHVLKGFLTFKKKLQAHMPAIEVKRLLGAAIWNSYFKFCVEREPVDKTVSHYSMLKNSPYHNRKTKHLTFEQYILQGNYPVDTQKYTDKNGVLIVDKILKYENLAEEFRSIGIKLGFNVSLQTRAKSEFREKINVTDIQKRKIYEAFEESNVYTGYRLSDPLVN